LCSDADVVILISSAGTVSGSDWDLALRFAAAFVDALSAGYTRPRSVA
jgi:hypothetical protein